MRIVYSVCVCVCLCVCVFFKYTHTKLHWFTVSGHNCLYFYIFKKLLSYFLEDCCLTWIFCVGAEHPQEIGRKQHSGDWRGQFAPPLFFVFTILAVLSLLSALGKCWREWEVRNTLTYTHTLCICFWEKERCTHTHTHTHTHTQSLLSAHSATARSQSLHNHNCLDNPFIITITSTHSPGLTNYLVHHS